MSSIARVIAEIVKDANAVTLEGGYCIGVRHERFTFPPCTAVKKKLNEAGRCIYLDALYSDGSMLRFVWSEARGPVYTVVKE